jgi:hypothetical protein
MAGQIHLPPSPAGGTMKVRCGPRPGAPDLLVALGGPHVSWPRPVIPHPRSCDAYRGPGWREFRVAWSMRAAGRLSYTITKVH